MQETNPDFTYLASMFEALDLMLWNNAPACDMTVLNRTGHAWFRHDVAKLNEADYDRFIATEAAINTTIDLPQCKRLRREDAKLHEEVNAYLCSLASQEIEPLDHSRTLERAYPGVEPSQTPGEWLARINAAHIAENVRTPFRFAYRVRVNVREKIALFNVEVPKPISMIIYTDDAKEQAVMARDYALRLSYLLASMLLETTPQLEKVVVTCCEHRRAKSILATTFTREVVAQLTDVVEADTIDAAVFTSNDAIQAKIDEQSGWFVPFKSPLNANDELVSPRDRFIYPELSDAALSPRLAERTGGRVISDLAFNENAARIEAADRLEIKWNALDSYSCESLVKLLSDIRDTTPNYTVLEACARTISALNEGLVDPADIRAIRMLFIAAGPLDKAVDQSAKLLEDDGHPNPMEAANILSEVLDPIRSLGEYADDELTVYRYFDGISQRLTYNTKVDDHRRDVKLVPDAYFQALNNLCLAYMALGKKKEALEIADEILQIAPLSVFGALRKVRILEDNEQVYDAAMLLKQMLAYASNPHDTALAYYRLAYLEWKLGREDLAVACYQRAMTWKTPVYKQTVEELDNLLANHPKLHFMPDEEVYALLKKEGIPLGFDDEVLDRMNQTAVLLVDEGFFWSARSVVSVLYSVAGDDELSGVYRSLNNPPLANSDS